MPQDEADLWRVRVVSLARDRIDRENGGRERRRLGGWRGRTEGALPGYWVVRVAATASGLVPRKPARRLVVVEDAMAPATEAILDRIKKLWPGASAVGLIEAREPSAERIAELMNAGAALARARSEGVTGKAVTPFLLGEVARLLGPPVVEANLALLEENARAAGEVAAALARRR